MASPSVNVHHTAHPPYIQSSLLGAVTHGFFGRQGGVSSGPFESLNVSLSTGDTPELIAENRARIAAAMGVAPEKLSVLRQIHSATCHIVGYDAFSFGTVSPEGDAMVTRQAGQALGIVTGDCGPLLFAAGPVVGAAHAGWQGALGGVLEATITRMEELGAKRPDIKVALGPCIAQKSYEVSAGFEAPFLAEDPHAEMFFKHGRVPDKLFFDLPGYIAFRLARAGVGPVDVLGHDTCALETDYFSHRRATKQGAKARGLQLSVIVCPA